MVVERMKQPQVQKPARSGSMPADKRADPVFIGLGPAVASFENANPVRPQQMQFPHRLADPERLDIGIARKQQMAVKRLQEIDAAHPAVRPGKQRQHRMLARLLRALVEQKRHRGRSFRNQPDGPVRGRVLHEPLARKPGIGAARPVRPRLLRQRNEPRGGLGLGHGCAIRRAPPRQSKGVFHRL